MRGSGVGRLGLRLQHARGASGVGWTSRAKVRTNRALGDDSGDSWDKRLCTTKGWMQDGREETKTKA